MQRAFIIRPFDGHPGGRELAFSFQDNELLDHEGPTAGKPQIPGVCRVHYRASTEAGSGGSPVFNARPVAGDRAPPQGRQDRHAEAQWPVGRIQRQRGHRDPVDQGGDRRAMSRATWSWEDPCPLKRAAFTAKSDLPIPHRQL